LFELKIIVGQKDFLFSENELPNEKVRSHGGRNEIKELINYSFIVGENFMRSWRKVLLRNLQTARQDICNTL
jgi:hypothetical protein